MKANNLTISIPYRGCDRNCPYCVSKMTGYLTAHEEAFSGNLEKVRTVADNCGITSLLVTGKGEPFLNTDTIDLLLDVFGDYPFEIQTNGHQLMTWFNEDPDSFLDRCRLTGGINVFAVSLDRLKSLQTYRDMFRTLDDAGAVIRVTMNASTWLKDAPFDTFIQECLESQVRQFSIRKLTIPHFVDNKMSKDYQKTTQWINDHADGTEYDRLIKEFMGGSYEKLRKLNFGATIFDVRGVSFTHFDYCIQDSNRGEDIRSLIYQEDGHLYTSWNSRASIIF